MQHVQVSGSPALTDACMERILGRGVLTDLRRLVITHPLSLGHMVVPLTTITVNRIQVSSMITLENKSLNQCNIFFSAAVLISSAWVI